MWFAWLRTREDRDEPTATSGERLIQVIYNIIWWVPVAVAVVGVVSYRVGFMGFLAVTVVRALINGYRINVMPIAAAERLPLRSP